MKTHRAFKDLGKTQLGWLDSSHSFSFGQYHDRAHMGFGPLRVINNDIVKGGAGFSPHAHNNMEIITYVIKGALAHRDSLGNQSTIEAGNIQVMSAGSGITHSEYNANELENVHFYQIWIKPNVLNEPPTYQERALVDVNTSNTLSPIVTPDGQGGTLRIKQNATLALGRFEAGKTLNLPATHNQKIWVQMIEGAAQTEDITLNTGDGLSLENEDATALTFTQNTELLVFIIPPTE
jgi:redox-sensitive bicupin YhaK (pirin superfamily)